MILHNISINADYVSYVIVTSMDQSVRNKLGLSWAKLSCQLGFGCTGINIFCLILINMKLLDT